MTSSVREDPSLPAVSDLTRRQFLERIRVLWNEHSPEYKRLAKASAIAERAHREIMREDGHCYFEHPLAVAFILLDELNVTDADAICVALLHDVVEENPHEWEIAKIHEAFDERIARGVWFMTRPADEVTSTGPSYPTRFWFAPRWIVMVKLADRLHGLRTLASCSLAKQLRKIEENRRDYLPLARYWNILAEEIEAQVNRPPALKAS